MSDSKSTGMSEAKRRLLEQWRKGGGAAVTPKAAQKAATGIPPRSDDGPAPLSFSQQRFWFLHQLEPESPAYHLSRVVRLRGPLDRDALTRAVAELVARHESLRTVFPDTAEGARAVLLPVERVALQIETFDAGDDAALDGFLDRTVRAPFDLTDGPLFRPCLAALAEDDHVLALAMHHILSDGWSLGVLQRELQRLYRAFAAGRPSPLDPLPIQYADVATWQRSPEQEASLDQALDYWRQTLDGANQRLELPTDRPRPTVRSTRGATFTTRLPRELSERLRAYARARGTTLYSATLATVGALLHRLSGQDDLLIGTPVANRGRAEVQHLIGPFLDTQVVRLRPRADLNDLTAQVHGALLDAEPHQHLPFQRLIDELAPERETGRTPVFQVMFTFQNAESAAAGPATGAEAGFGDALTAEPIVVDVDAAMFDLLIMAVDGPEGLGLRFEYAAELFDEATIGRWVEHLRVLLDAGLDAPERPVGALPLLDEDGRRAMLAMDDWVTRTHEVPMGPIPVEPSLDVLFGRTVEEHGERLALVDGTRRWTYRELARRADRLAHHLRSLGAGPERLVGICLERSAESLVAILGVLRAGAAYLPIDTVYPPDRQAFMLDDAGAPVLITQASLLDRVPEDPAYTVVLLDDALSTIPEAPAGPPEPLGEGDRLAYVIYTSGSTGKPKGVMVAHRQVVRLLRATEPHYAFSSDDVWPLFHSIAFDVSVWEIWGALLYGGRLVIVDHETSRTPDAFFALLRDERATWLNQTPSAFFQLLRCEAVLDPEQGLPDLRAVSFAGEPLDIPALRPWFERYGEGGAPGRDDGRPSDGPHMINMYGITETTVHVGYRRLFAADTEPATGGAIGGPMADLRQRLLDDELQPVPIGVPGEIYVAGDGVARGYLKRPGLTAERFVPDPFSTTPGARLYRSGDRARFRADGDLESLGRADHQVKIRGFRIELGEIHEVLVAHDDVAEAVVIVREDTPGDPRLVGYVVPRAGVEAPSAPTLRQHLRASLPDYMVPAAFVPLERLPQTAGSKLDRRALPAPSTDRPDQEVDFVAPRDEVEQTIGAVWSEVLGLDRIGIYDSFFDLGGNSMLLVKSYGPLRQRLGESLRLVDLIRNPTILSLASHLAEGKDSAPEARPDDGAAVRGRRAGADRLRRLKQRRRSR